METIRSYEKSGIIYPSKQHNMAAVSDLQLICTLVVLRKLFTLFLTFTGPFIVNLFAEYNQQDATFHNLFISVRTCFRRFFSVHHKELKTALLLRKQSGTPTGYPGQQQVAVLV